MTGNKRTYVFIPGGWHGGWAFDPITTRLKAMNKQSFSLTLPGLEPEPVQHSAIINLSTHIQFVVDFIIDHQLTDVILCSHSYGGLVITGVADSIPDRIHALVYIDAYIPSHGDSCWKLTSEHYRRLFATGAEEDGYMVAVPPGAESRRRPQHLATFIQTLQLNGQHEQIANRIFIYLSGWEGSPFQKQYETLKNSPNWRIETIDCGHNAMMHRPDDLTAVLVDIDK